MTKLVRSIALSLSIASLSAISVVACGGSVEQPQTSASAATKAPIGAETHGAVKLIGEALGEVPLRADQRATLEKLAQESDARHTPMFAGRKDAILTLADQIEKGAIDRAALQVKIDKMAADLEKSQSDDRAAIVKLHDVLDAQQRGLLVDALESRMKAGRHRGPGEIGGKGRGHDGAKGFMHMKQLAEDLKLTDDQKTKIHEVMRDSFKDAMKAHHEGREHDGKRGGRGEWKGHGGPHGALEAFREDKLDLDKVVPAKDPKQTAKLGAEHVLGTVEKILPILTPEQRKIAADKLRTMAERGDASLLVH